MSVPRQSKNFSLTMNNPVMPINEFADLINVDALYARCQSEKGENGTLHYQACVGYAKRMSTAAIIKRFKGCHVEVTRNALAAWDYCAKEDTRVEGPYSHGIPPAALNVKGSKAKTALEIIAMGADKALQEGHVNLLNYGKIVNNIDLYTNRTQKVEQLDKELDLQDLNIWYYGPPGSGKTSKAINDHPAYYEKDKSKFWNGYTTQETVLIDDLEKEETFMKAHLKKWVQHKAFPAEDKFGQMRQIRPKRFIVTSNYKIEEIWEDEIDRLALGRRFKQIKIIRPF